MSEREQLAERIYETAVAFKEADDDKTTGKWALSARWADYTGALHAHALFTIHEFKAAQAKEQEAK